jgi:acyl-CoA hydrolase/GNAT superfamily N-acetyltransferase
MSDWQAVHANKRATLAEAIALIPRGKHILLGSGAAEPIGLVEELVVQSRRFADNTIVHLLTLGPAPYVEPRYADRFRHNAFFIGPNVREAVHAGRADYTPVFLSQLPDLLRRRRIPVDVALIMTTPPDPFGYVNLGVSVDILLAAIDAAELVIAEVNPRMPVVHGSGYVPMDSIDAWVLHETELPVLAPEPLDDVALEIGRHVASLVEDGATLQVGIGQIPDAVVQSLGHKHELGIWTEMLSDGLVRLVREGNVTGRFKTLEPRKVSASFSFGSPESYAFLDRNPTFHFHPSDFINDPVRIAQQHKMVAINSAIQVDLTGQVCADSIGTRFYAGIGGQVDFIRGASMSRGGKPIIAMRSTARQGQLSRVVATLEEGAGVVTSRGDVRYVVTEYGIADLQGRSVRERAMALIDIAHPDHRAELLAGAKARRYVFADQIVPLPAYAERHERRVTAENGTPMLLRPVRVTDEQKLGDLFYRLSADTIYKRFMGFLKQLPHRERMHLMEVDDHQNVALVVATQPADEAESELLGVGSYHLDPASSFAEVAFVVRDDWQRQGLCKALMEQLTTIAKGYGIAGFTAEVLADNLPMLHVFHRSGLHVQSSYEGDVLRLRMPFAQPAGDVPPGFSGTW